MDETLAGIYGTNGAQAADVEKLAQAEMATKLAETGQVDFSNMTAEEIEAVAAEVVGGEPAPQAAAPTNTDPAPTDDEFKEKISQADYAGRVMAHAMVNELRQIEEARTKTASAMPDASRIGRLKSWASSKKIQAGMNLGAHAGKAAAGAAAVGGAAGVAAGRASKKEKTSAAGPAFTQLVGERVEELLTASGFKPDEVFAQLEKQSSAQPATPAAAPQETADPRRAALAQAVDAEAIETLKEMGFTFEAQQ